MADPWNAYINEDLKLEPTGEGSLQGLRFAAKDVFAVKGWTNTAGNPDWLRTHGPAPETAAAIRKLLERGAALRGVTITDELMYSLYGENAYYGTPVNPAMPERIPGGSSSGSASAAAAGLADFALGTDTGGSVRVPSAYCGLYGFRPTHGAVPMQGVIPLAPSFDTVGWMSRDPDIMLRAGEALLPATEEEMQHNPVLHVIEEAWALADPEYRAHLEEILAVFESSAGGSKRVSAAPEGLPALYEAFRTIQGYEIWQTHGEWIRREKPRFGPDIGGRFEWAQTVKEEDCRRQLKVKAEVSGRLDRLLSDGGLLVLPTVPCGPPARGKSGEGGNALRARMMQLSCLAGLAGLPQYTIPVGRAAGAPAAISFIAGRGRDLRLLRWVRQAVEECRIAGPWTRGTIRLNHHKGG